MSWDRGRGELGFRPRRLTELWSADATSGGVRVLSDARLSLDEFALDGVSCLIWERCDGVHTVESIVDEVLANCDGRAPSRAQVEQDVQKFLGELRSEGLVDWQRDDAVDVLLVIPPFPTTYSSEAIETPEYSSPPLGLAYIAAVLRDQGFRVAIADLHVSSSKPEDVVAVCRQRRPAIVGITATTPSYPNAERVARFVKAHDRQITVVMGGAHATGLPEQCIRSGAFDFVCIGEGEEPMLRLTETLLRNGNNPSNIPNLLHLSSKGEPIWHDRHSASGALPKPDRIDLDELPFPARELLDLDRYYQKGAIISTRGCPIDCNFCACAAIVGRTYRMHSIDYVLREVEAVQTRYGYRFFDFHDDTFNLKASRVFDFCEEVKRRGIKFEWGCFCRAAQLTPEMAQAMADAGCRVIQFGVEAGSDAMLKSIKKATSVRQIEEAVRAASAAGIQQIVCGFIVGHAEDTEVSVRQTIGFGLRLHELGATRLTLSLLTPYPGTEVYIRREELGISLLTEDWEQYIFSRVVMETSQLKRDRLRELYVEGLRAFLDVSDMPQQRSKRVPQSLTTAS